MKSSDIELLEQRIILEARQSFWAFRRYMHPKYVYGWFQYDVCSHLQSWYDDYVAQKKPTLILNTPPQHGKSDMIMDFAVWLLGKSPNLRVIYASFSERLAVRANLSVQRIMTSSKYGKVFPNVKIPSVSDKMHTRSRELLELIDANGEITGGCFRNTTVRGSITGESLDIGIIDDPIKGREQANSETIRETTWEWFTDDFFTRFSENAGQISIATRWHIDDPIGRLIDRNPDCKVFSYPALAERGEYNKKTTTERDLKYRKEGDALFPELKSKEFLLIRKKMQSNESWQSLYQQNPVAIGGNLIKTAYFKRYSVLPPLQYMRIFVDTAAKTKQINDYTVFGLYGLGRDNGLYILDILRGKWEYTEMKQRARDFWFKNKARCINGWDAVLRDMAVEDKSAGIQLIQELNYEAMIPITPIERKLDKYTRLQDVIGYINSGYIHVPESGENAPWIDDFLRECECFTGLGDTHDDQVDTLMDAIFYMLANDQFNIKIWESLY